MREGQNDEIRIIEFEVQSFFVCDLRPDYGGNTRVRA
jgi:hypothetical protein